jgi:hypothetical protein
MTNIRHFNLSFVTITKHDSYYVATTDCHTLRGDAFNTAWRKVRFTNYSSPDYPTFGYPTFSFIRRTVSERSILSTVRSACSKMNQLTDNDTVDLVNLAGDDDLEDNNEGPEKTDRMSHSEGLYSMETVLACVEQREATATDVLLFRRWRDLVAKKRKEAQKQIPTINFCEK